MYDNPLVVREVISNQPHVPAFIGNGTKFSRAESAGLALAGWLSASDSEQRGHGVRRID